MSDRLPGVLGTIGLASVGCGYLMEVMRQRGDCEWGNPHPDTLPASVALIFLGGGGAGFIGLLVGLFRSVRAKHLVWSRIVVPACSVLAGTSLFLFIDSGPGGWFQYCGS